MVYRDLAEVAYHLLSDYHWEVNEVVDFLVRFKGVGKEEAREIVKDAESFSGYLDSRRRRGL